MILDKSFQRLRHAAPACREEQAEAALQGSAGI